jgi:hypothetical protein
MGVPRTVTPLQGYAVIRTVNPGLRWRSSLGCFFGCAIHARPALPLLPGLMMSSGVMTIAPRTFVVCDGD